MSQIGICCIVSWRKTLQRRRSKIILYRMLRCLLRAKLFSLRRSVTMTTEENSQNVTSQHISLREEVERELRVRAWKDEAFRQELIADPKGVIERLFPQYFPDGKAPDKVTYKVIVEDAYTHHILLPALPEELTSQTSAEKL